jgi:hypothetical protein
MIQRLTRTLTGPGGLEYDHETQPVDPVDATDDLINVHTFRSCEETPSIKKYRLQEFLDPGFELPRVEYEFRWIHVPANYMNCADVRTILNRSIQC